MRVCGYVESRYVIYIDFYVTTYRPKSKNNMKCMQRDKNQERALYVYGR